MAAQVINRRTLFLSTPSARRATKSGDTWDMIAKISIHALCEEGDLSNAVPVIQRHHISIHALCEEGDWTT